MKNSITQSKKKQEKNIIGKFKAKKLQNKKLVDFIVKHVTSKIKDRISICGEFLQFVANSDLSKKKLMAHNGCNNRFCPMCAWRVARKNALKIGICMKYIENEHRKRFLFLTLTAPNVEGDKLKDELDKFNHSFKKLMERKELKDMNKGYVRKLEITYNKEENTYHPHFHVIIAVNKSYFKDTKIYLTHDKFLDLWRDVMQDQTITQVDVRAVGESKHLKDKSISEIAKYSAKDSDYLVSQEVFDVFYLALKNRQELTFNGLFKDAIKMFKAGELDKYKEVDETEYMYFMLYRWGFGEYVESEIRELTEEEKKKVNKQLIEEDENVD